MRTPLMSNVRAPKDEPVSRFSAVLLAALTSGCVGTMDSLHAVKGQAPQTPGCDVAVSEAGTGRLIRKEKVHGNFSVDYTAGGPFPPKVDIAAYCNGTKVKELKAVAPRTVGEIDLGKLAP